MTTAPAPIREDAAAPGRIRVVTAASLFDGHDAAINVMRRIIQASGAEVIHLGHDRSVDEVVNCAIQEDANAIAMTSYQGGHVEYLKYMAESDNDDVECLSAILSSAPTNVKDIEEHADVLAVVSSSSS